MFKTVILAGGRGERLRPITDQVPKPMIPVNGRPFLEYQLRLLNQYGLKQIVLCVGYLKDKFSAYFGDGSSFSLKIEYAIEEGFLGTAGALKNARNYLDADFLLLYGDSYLPIDYGALIAAWEKCNASALVVCYENKDAIARNNITLDETGAVRSYSKRNPDLQANYVEAGVSILKREVLDLIPEGKPVSLEEEIFPLLIARSQLKGYPVAQRYYDIGTTQGLKETEKILKKCL